MGIESTDGGTCFAFLEQTLVDLFIGRNGRETTPRKDAGDSSPAGPLAPLYHRAATNFFSACMRRVQPGRGEPSCLQRT